MKISNPKNSGDIQRLAGIFLILAALALLVLWSFARKTTSPESTLPATPSLPSATPTTSASPFQTQRPPTTTPTLQPSPLPDPPAWDMRAGFGISASARADVWAERLNAGWYLNWSAHPSGESSQTEFWPMVRLIKGGYRPTLSEIRLLAKNKPGQVWILGNEPDVIWQDNTPAEDYARAYHELYQAIKEADPSAHIAVAGISQVTPLRLEYLDRVLSAYRQHYQEEMPVDWWTVHIYTLREEHQSWGVEIPPGFDVQQGMLYEISDHGRLDLFEAQLRDFRAWMKQNGYQDKPLAVTEFGILMPAEYGFPPDFVADYLQDTFQILATAQDQQDGYAPDATRLAQRWAWFSLSDPNYPSADLANLDEDKLTTIGGAFRAFVQAAASP